MNWHDANQRYLTAALNVIRARLTHADTMPAEKTVQDIAADMARPAALETLCATFSLSAFEREVLLLCLGIELDAGFAALCAEAQGKPGRALPTFSLALATLADPHWSGITPVAPLRRWHLIDVGAGDALTNSPLRIDERILHYLVGVACMDERLRGLIEPIAAPDDLPPSHRMLVERILAWWMNGDPAAFVQLTGSDPLATAAVAAAAAAQSGLPLYGMRASNLPAEAAERDTLVRLWEREAILSGAVLLVEIGDVPEGSRAAVEFIDRVRGMLFVSSHDPVRESRRPSVPLAINKPTRTEQEAIWGRTLGQLKTDLDGQTRTLVTQFDLSAHHIASAGAAALEMLQSSPDMPVFSAVWDACRAGSRPRLGDLAQRIESNMAWDDLVLPEPQREILREIVAHTRGRAKVYDEWGFAARSARGLGITALFAGSSGTGKTLAAEVMACELRLDLYRIDLSSVVSKYIGETEKNLRRIFEAAEDGGAILLFDEADALFGKRSEVKDSHDRYANIEVSYLLQQMEAYHGLAILTTNMRGALDTAFLRRIRFIVEFPFPDVTSRAQIWQRVFPLGTPTDHLDPLKLARLNVTGGNIRNIALNAAFLAAQSGEPVRMKHLRRAAAGEYAKLEKPLTDAEVGGIA